MESTIERNFVDRDIIVRAFEEEFHLFLKTWYAKFYSRILLLLLAQSYLWENSTRLES